MLLIRMKKLSDHSDEYNKNRDKNTFTKIELESYMKWEDKIAMRDNFADSFNSSVKLAVYLYTYFPSRKLLDYYQMYFSNNISTIIKNKDKKIILL